MASTKDKRQAAAALAQLANNLEQYVSDHPKCSSINPEGIRFGLVNYAYECVVPDIKGGFDAQGECQVSKSIFTSYVTAVRHVEGFIDSMMFLDSQSYIDTVDVASVVLYMLRNVSGIGAYNAKLITCIMQGSCTTQQALIYDIVEDLLYKGTIYTKNSVGYFVPNSGNTAIPVESYVRTTQKLQIPEAVSVQIYNILHKSDLFVQYRMTIAGANIDEHYIVPKDTADIEQHLADLTHGTQSLDWSAVAPSGLSDHQMSAYTAISQDSGLMTILTGDAGTGKSYTVARVIQAAIDAGVTVGVVCPTYAAIKALTTEMAACGVDTQSLWCRNVITIDSAKYRTSDGCPDLLIIDEAAMCSTKHYGILTQMQPRKILLVGHVSQLAPVDPGCPFSDLVSDPLRRVQIVALTEQRRSAVPGIQALTTSIQDAGTQDLDLASHRALNPMHVIPCYSTSYNGSAKSDAMPDPSQVAVLAAYIRQNIDATWISDKNEHVDAINYAIYRIKNTADTRIHHQMALALAMCEKQTKPMDLQIPYYITRETIDKDTPVIWDGDRIDSAIKGYVIARGCEGVSVGGGIVEMDAIKVLPTIPGYSMIKVRISIDDFPCIGKDRLRYRYAMTTHKSQGKTYGDVVYYVKDVYTQMYKGISRRSAYVACSRASTSIQMVSIYSKISTLLYDITPRKTHLRRVMHPAAQIEVV